LRFFGRDRRVAFDETGEHAAQRFDAERKRRNVEQENVFDIALQNAALNGRAVGDDFVRVDALVRFLAEEALTVSMIFGMRVIPPTRTTSSMSEALTPASFSAAFTGPAVRLMRSSTSDSSFARVSLMLRCFGPDASAVMKGRLTSVCVVEESSIFAFSAASFRRCSASLSLRRSMSVLF
jgi:hypothetical protein